MTQRPQHDPPEGRRERKRRETRERIAQQGVRLFLELGYEGTTLDAIAAAADVSRRTLFQYFAAKEDVVFASQEDFLICVAGEIGRRPPQEPWPVLVEHAIAAAVVAAASPENIAIDALVRRTPALQSRHQLKYVHLEQAIAGALLLRSDGSQAARARADLLAALVVAGFRLAARDGGERSLRGTDDARRSVAQAFRSFWRALRDFGEEGLASGSSSPAGAGRDRSRAAARKAAKPRG